MTSRRGEQVLIFGASGALGSVIADRLSDQGVDVTRMIRNHSADDGSLSLANPGWAAQVRTRSITGVVWAQGENASGSILTDGPSQLRSLLEANVVFIVDSLRQLIEYDCLAKPSRLVIVSSIWQRISRSDKLAYMTSKSALAGLVGSLVVDLGDHDVSVNAVLPGVVESPMSLSFLGAKGLAAVRDQTPGRRLIEPENIAEVCSWLVSPQSAGVNGQFIVVDGGWSDTKNF